LKPLHLKESLIFKGCSSAIFQKYAASMQAIPTSSPYILHQRRCSVENAREELRLRIILDRFSCEVFIDGGRKVMTSALYTDQSAKKVSFRADGEVLMDITKYDIVP
jgi:sucrose-6-phosphate hydrolase SacC (GH32 family)